MAYWRWRFLTDSERLRDKELLNEYTLFSATVSGISLNLERALWSGKADLWTDPNDYAATQAVADQARQRAIDWIAYASDRHPGEECAAALNPGCLALRSLTMQQTWSCKVQATHALMRHQSGSDFVELRFGQRKAGA